MNPLQKPIKRISAKRLKQLGGKLPFSTITRAPKRIRKKPRSKSDFARIYGSKARVRWIKDRPCIYCTALSPLFGVAGESHNAHTVVGGTGYKADHTTIVPLCGSHHLRYDRHLFPFDNEEARQTMKDAAALVEALWQVYSASFSKDST